MQPDEHETETSKASATVPAGITAHTDEAAAREARAMEREARREGATHSPLARTRGAHRGSEAVGARIRCARDHARPQPSQQRRPRVRVLRGSLKAAGVSIGRWIDAVNAAARAAKKARVTLRRTAMLARLRPERVALDARREAERERRADTEHPRQRTSTRTSRRATTARYPVHDGTGLTTAETATRRGETETHDVLARASGADRGPCQRVRHARRIPVLEAASLIMCGATRRSSRKHRWSTGRRGARGSMPPSPREAPFPRTAGSAPCSSMRSERVPRAWSEVRRYGFTGWIVRARARARTSSMGREPSAQRATSRVSMWRPKARPR